MSKKLPYKHFVERAIKTLRKPPHRGIHVVYSQFNAAFREYYDEEPGPILEKLASEGFVAMRPARGGALLILTADLYEHEANSWSTVQVLGKILGEV